MLGWQLFCVCYRLQAVAANHRQGPCSREPHRRHAYVAAGRQLEGLEAGQKGTERLPPHKRLCSCGLSLPSLCPCRGSLCPPGPSRTCPPAGSQRSAEQPAAGLLLQRFERLRPEGQRCVAAAWKADNRAHQLLLHKLSAMLPFEAVPACRLQAALVRGRAPGCLSKPGQASGRAGAAWAQQQRLGTRHSTSTACGATLLQ